MKQKLSILVLLVVSSTVQCEEENFLLGTWVSSKDETISYNRSKANWTEDQYKIFDKILGKLQLRITPTSVEWEYEGDTDKNKYEIIELTKDSITIRLIIRKEELEYFGLMNYPLEDVMFHRVDDLIYIEPKKSKTLLREYFKKVEK